MFVKWKNKYTVSWCSDCRTAIISCNEPSCGGSYCNGGGCKKCHDDFQEFGGYKTRVENYLTEDEIKIYYKCEKLKSLIVETIAEGDKKIDWKKLTEQGQLSDHDRILFDIPDEWKYIGK